jgi:hypothetical protein
MGLLPVDVKLYAAHMQEPPATPMAPVMGYADLKALHAVLASRTTLYSIFRVTTRRFIRCVGP